ncbi:phage tail protein, partial [Nonomuraea sp. NPDC003201]
MTRDELAALLPAIHRSRDEERGHPLRALLRIIEEQVRVIDDDLDTWYANWFVETCDEWIVPYVAALVGIDREGVSRAEVADAVAVRRRKGTAAALEQLAFDVAG